MTLAYTAEGCTARSLLLHGCCMQLTGQGDVLSDRCACCGGAKSHGNRRSCLGHHDVQHLRAGSRSWSTELQRAHPERVYALRNFGKNRDPFLIQSSSHATRPAPPTPFPCHRGWAPAARTQAASQGGRQGRKPTLRGRPASSRSCSAARYAHGRKPLRGTPPTVCVFPKCCSPGAPAPRLNGMLCAQQLRNWPNCAVLRGPGRRCEWGVGGCL